MRASLERHIEIKVLRPQMRIFCFLPRQAAARDNSGATEGARVGEAGAAAEAPARSAVGGGGGDVGPRIM
jgi:hypothetical protein